MQKSGLVAPIMAAALVTVPLVPGIKYPTIRKPS
jgi:hypothetical protein